MSSHPDEANTGRPDTVRDERPHIEEDRRQTPRVDLLREFQGRLLALDEAVTVQQLGPGGLTVIAAVPLSPTQIHDLRLTLDDAVISIRARVVHSRAVVDSDDVTYVSGLAFVDPPAETLAIIEHFIGLDVFADGR
ncbi:MAG: PilZ domain-containing protein [Vicinamibacteraceae bacterium]